MFQVWLDLKVKEDRSGIQLQKEQLMDWQDQCQEIWVDLELEL